MAKKTQAEDEIIVVLGTISRSGRSPKMEETLDRQLMQLIKECEGWTRRAGEVWFGAMSSIDCARGCLDTPDILGRYDKAIFRLKQVIAYAQYGLEVTEKGREKAKSKLEQGRSEAIKRTKAAKAPKKKSKR